MSQQHMITFQEALEVIESLPDAQQESLINIVQHRLIEHKRKLLAESIQKTKEEYAKGKVKKGTVAELMRDLAE